MNVPCPAAAVGPAGRPPVARTDGVGLRYGLTVALEGVSLDIPAGCTVGFIGPDGVGKSSLLALISGARKVQSGRIEVLDGDMSSARHRNRVCPRIAYMPQGLGKNLYPTLSVRENADFFGRLFGQGRREREGRIADLLRATGLAAFADRPAGKLSGGMKQKLGLCCALIHDPDLLVLDEPTTGVDPLSRRQFWELIGSMRAHRQGMSVLIATAYMEEAARFDWLVAMSGGRVLAAGTPADLLGRTGSASLEEAFIALLPAAQREGYRPVVIPPRDAGMDGVAAIEAKGLTMRFGDFTAVDDVSFRIGRGEIFGFLGSNGCGKTTTMKMLTGLLPASSGQAWLFGHPVDPHDLETRRRVGYMTQSFSLYGELTVRQNLALHARLFRMPEERIAPRIEEMVRRFGLAEAQDSLPDALPLGQRQRLSLAVAMIHAPEMLILDEPTSGVDPIARDSFWQTMLDLARNDGVTIFISTHFMNEAERCDRVSLMHAGRVLASDTPAAIAGGRGVETLEEAFISHLEVAGRRAPGLPESAGGAEPAAVAGPERHATRPARMLGLDMRRLISYAWRESLELRRDPIRLALAILGSVILMLVMALGITLDVEDLTFAVMDRDQTTASRDYALSLSGSRYFSERPPVGSYEELDRRMRAGEISLAIEIPPGFARSIARGETATVGAWIDGAMPIRAETLRGYTQGIHAHWLAARMKEARGPEAVAGNFSLETRFRYNPDVKSLPAMAPAVMPLLLLLIPAILTALSVVREKELGSIINFYVTPVTRLEFLLGKQAPYVALGMVNFLLLTAMTVFLFDVPMTGSFPALAAAMLVYLMATTAFGLLISAFVKSQVAALFGTAVLTLLPASLFSGLLNPVSSLEGVGRAIGSVYPTTHALIISRGAFSKGLGFAELQGEFLPLLLAVPVLVGLGAALLGKQER